MTITIDDYELEDRTHNVYDVHFFNDTIHTLVTHTPSLVNTWISETQPKLLRDSNVNPALVGLDIEWRPNRSPRYENPVAILQLSTGQDCLIFQFLHCNGEIPQSLFNFLTDTRFTFVGVGIQSDVEKLVEHYGLNVGNMVDLRRLAAEKLGVVEMKNFGLKALVREILGKVVEKPRRITMSRWDSEWLTSGQVQYACLDAFLCCKIGQRLYAA